MSVAQTTPVVPSGVSQASYVLNVQQSIFNDPAIFWQDRASCEGVIGAGLPNGTAPGAPGDELRPSVIWRGSTSLATPRKIFEYNPTRPVGTCNPHRMLSNLAVDSTHVYYIDNLGPGGNAAIWRRPRNANVGDPSQLLVNLNVAASTLESAEMLAAGVSLFVIFHGAAAFDVLSQYHRETGALLADGISAGGKNTHRNLQFDGRFVYWINDLVLVEYDTTTTDLAIVSFNVATYLAEGDQTFCDVGGCEGERRVTFSERTNATGVRLITTDRLSGFTTVQHTAPPNTSIGAIANGQFGYFFFTRGPAPFGGPFDREERLLRKVGGGAAQLIYGPFLNVLGFDAFTTDFAFLYFRDVTNRSLLRLPTDAAAIPTFRLRATGLEITQGIQRPDNSIDLFNGKRTFARFYVRSDGAADVPNVSASLDVNGPEGFLGRLEPVNGVNKRLNVLRTPRRSNLGDSFLFELPIAWTELAFLQFGANVNSSRALIEDTYADNTAETPILPFTQSARLPLEIISWSYLSGGSVILGGTLDNLESEFYLRKLYPLAQESGGIAQPGRGLRVGTRFIIDNELTDQVDRTDATCINMRGVSLPARPTDDRNQCAGDYVMGRVRAMKADGTLPDDRYYYSSIAGDATTLFTRGYAIESERAACGPRRDPSPQQNYMAHEVGHLLGRGHPNSGAAPVCPNQGASDPGYPYPQARIGPSTTAAGDETADMGLDVGTAVNQFATRTIRTSSTHGDLMSYCRPYWVSSHTLDALSLWMSVTNPLGAALPRAAGAPVAAAVPGDWLSATGTISFTGGTAAFVRVQRLPSVAEVPVLVDGGVALELRSAGGALLARHPFTPDAIDDGSPGYAGFGLVVPFAAGTRSIRIVKGAGEVLATHPVSASPPQITNVAVVGGVVPPAGTVRVEWTSSDPDGGSLLHDLHYSRDDGVTWRPLHLSISGSGVDVDAAVLPGGTGRFRVDVSDGALVARGVSPAYVVAPKPARVAIDTPADGTRIDWGQVLNLGASVDDFQGAVIPPGNITWANAYRTLGTGPIVSVSDLEVGTNLITVTVLDASGMPTFATVTVHVGDSVLPPGPRLSASPASIAWQVPGAASAVVQQELLVRNAGGGESLPFRVSSDAAWLRVNGAASVDTFADVTLTVTANASGLPDAAVSEGTLRVENLAVPGDVLEVKVALAKGDLVGAQPASDRDGDGVDDGADDCILAADGPTLPGAPALVQRDTDGDGFGNVCDADLNDDGIVNFADLQRMKQVFFGNDPDADLNGDGVVNFGDLARMKSGFFIAPGPSAKAP